LKIWGAKTVLLSQISKTWKVKARFSRPWPLVDPPHSVPSFEFLSYISTSCHIRANDLLLENFLTDIIKWFLPSFRMKVYLFIMHVFNFQDIQYGWFCCSLSVCACMCMSSLVGLELWVLMKEIGPWTWICLFGVWVLVIGVSQNTFVMWAYMCSKFHVKV